MITLKNESLRVEIAEPGEHPNDAVRFDRAGFITDVLLNNEREFCANEPKNLSHPTSGGRGFCCELKQDVSGEFKIGEKFPKFGVGLITKEDEDKYVFHKKYKEIEYFPVTWKAGETTAEFTTEPIPCGGYALKEYKKISLDGNSIFVEYTVENVGEKNVDIQEYCHNFVSIDGMALSPDYYLDMPNLRDFGNEEQSSTGGYTYCNLIGNGHGFTFREVNHNVSLVDVDLTGMTEGPFCWKLGHKGAKAYVAGEDSYTPCGIAIWAVDHIVSTENFNKVALAPGEKQSWTRKLTFVDETK